MALFKIYRETALPAFPLQPYAIYLIAPTAKPDYVEMYVTNSDGSAARRIIDEADIQSMINSAVANVNNIQVVADIAERDALAPTTTKYVYVKNATGDATVSSGGATYLYDTTASAWVKISEAESLDVSLTWDTLQGKPSSTADQIDTAVANSHTHSNKTQLDKVGEDAEGNLTYDGVIPHTAWDSVGW